MIIQNETLLDKAKQNYNVAKMIKNQMNGDEQYLNYIGYHLQQCVELAIKHMLEINGIEYPQKHEIEQLLLLAKESNVDVYETEYIDTHSEMLTSWEARTRYIKNYRLEARKIDTAFVEISQYLDIIENELFRNENERTNE